jgi:hypothetical protein
VVRFEAFGEAWRLFKQQAGTWIAATLIVGFAGAGVQFLLNILMIPIQMVGQAILPRGIFALTSLGSMAASMAVQGIFMGGMYGMAINQIDGRSMSVKILMPSTAVLPSLALASILASLATMLGFLCLVIPGWIVWGLFLFTLPLVVDRQLKATDSMGMSWTTLKGQWLQMTVFALVLWVIGIVGMLLCLVGTLVTFPLTVLAQAVLYRGFFASAGAPKKAVQALDPDFGPVGVDAAARPRGRIPVWAWLVAVTGLVAPVIVVGGAIALMLAVAMSASRDFQQNVRNQTGFQDGFGDLEKAGQGLPGPVPGQPGMPAPGEAPGGNMEDLQRKFEAEMQKMIEAQKKATGNRGEGKPKPADPEPQQAVAKPATSPRQDAVAKRATRPRQEAGETAGAPKANDLTAIVGDLTSNDEGVRRRALDRLARLTPDPSHHDEVTTALSPSLVHSLAAVRASAVKALGVWANPDDVPALIVALDDQDRGVRRAAIHALGQIKDARAAKGVARQLADRDVGVHNDAVRALRQIGSIAEAEVLKYVKSPDLRTRERACQVLQTIGTQDSVRELTKAASANSQVGRSAQAALKAIAARERTK